MRLFFTRCSLAYKIPDELKPLPLQKLASRAGRERVKNVSIIAVKYTSMICSDELTIGIMYTNLVCIRGRVLRPIRGRLR